MEAWHSDDIKALLSQILQLLPQTLQRLPRPLDVGECQTFEEGHGAVGRPFRAEAVDGLEHK